MHTKLKPLVACLVLLVCGAASAAQVSMDTPLTKSEVATFSWPQYTVQEVAAGERKVLAVCKATGSGLARRKCFIYVWSDDPSEWSPVVVFRSSTSRVDTTFADGKIILTSYGGKVLLELTAATLWPSYDAAELEQPRQRGKADEETIRNMSKP